VNQTIFFDRYCICTAPGDAPEEVSRSGAAINYKGIDTQSGELVELQLIPLAMIDGIRRKQLEERARAVQELNHINIARVFAIGVEREYFAIVSEYLRGETADKWVVARGPLSPDAALRVGIQVLGALAAGAFYGLVHRTIQPSNIILLQTDSPDGGWPLIKLLNFGVAASELHKEGSDGVVPIMGPQFASPEQLLRDKIDFRSEIYSLGAILSFLLTGRVPLVSNCAAIYGGIGTAPELNYLPRPIRRLLQRLLHENPEKRQQDPVALEAEMQRCLAKIERHATFRRSFLAPPTLLARTELSRPGVGWARALRGVFTGLGIIAMAATASAFLFPHVAAVWHHEIAVKPIGVPIGVSQLEPAQTSPVVAEQSVEPVRAPSVAPTFSPLPVREIEQKPVATDASQSEPEARSSLTRMSATKSIDSGYSGNGAIETTSSDSSESRSRASSATARHHGSDHGSRFFLAEQHAGAKAIARALPLDQDEAAQTNDSGEEGHPRFIGRTLDGSPVLRFPSGEIATVARPVEPNSLRRRHYDSARIEPRAIDNPPASDSDPGD
jgi:serine/threonine protein kinase